MWNYNYPDTLYHHGIKGMKWGDRNGPPYPLGSSARAGVDKRAERQKSVDKTSESSDNKKKTRLSDKQKKAIKIGAVVAGTVLASYGAYRLYKSGKLDGLINQGKTKTETLLNGTLDDKSTIGKSKIDIPKSAGKFKKLTSRQTIDDVVLNSNPTGAGGNCFNVVTAFTSRLCGLDVTAKGNMQDGKGMLFENVCKAFKLQSNDIKTMYDPTVDKLSKYIGNKYKEGDVGAIGLEWNNAYKQARFRYNHIPVSESAGHTLNWVIENGKAVFADGQAKQTDAWVRDYLRKYMDSGKEVSIARFANRIEGINPETDLDLELFKKMVK